MSIKARRKAVKMTQADVAQIMGVARMTISRWEKTQAELKAKHLKRLSKLFGCTVGELLSDE